MKRKFTFVVGLGLAVAIGIGTGAINGAAELPELGELSPLAPQGATDSGSNDQVLFIDDEPETPYIDGPGTEVLDGSGMVVPGFEGDVEDTVVETGVGMVVPGHEAIVTDTIVEFDE